MVDSQQKKNEDFESTIRNGLRDLKNSKYLKLLLTNKASTRVLRNLKWIVNYCNVLVIEINRMAIKSHNIRQVPQFRKGAWTTPTQKTPEVKFSNLKAGCMLNNAFNYISVMSS